MALPPNKRRRSEVSRTLLDQVCKYACKRWLNGARNQSAAEKLLAQWRHHICGNGPEMSSYNVWHSPDVQQAKLSLAALPIVRSDCLPPKGHCRP
jgi:hypothetical protein